MTYEQIGNRARLRKWAAPDLPLDVEEAHAAAVKDGKATYLDPATGYKVGAKLASCIHEVRAIALCSASGSALLICSSCLHSCALCSTRVCISSTLVGVQAILSCTMIHAS